MRRPRFTFDQPVERRQFDPFRRPPSADVNRRSSGFLPAALTHHRHKLSRERHSSRRAAFRRSPHFLAVWSASSHPDSRVWHLSHIPDAEGHHLTPSNPGESEEQGYVCLVPFETGHDFPQLFDGERVKPRVSFPYPFPSGR